LISFCNILFCELENQTYIRESNNDKFLSLPISELGCFTKDVL